MKRIITTLMGIILIGLILRAQEAPPQAFSFKATIKDNKGLPVLLRKISLRISILQGDMNGLAVYSEYFNPITNLYSQVDIEIGKGMVISGSFSAVDWSADEYFLKIEADVRGGTNYQLLSVTQLLSVPYALFAGRVLNNEDNDADPENELQNLSVSGHELTIEGGNTVTLPDNVDDADADPANEIQDLQLNGNILTITRNEAATTIDLSIYLDDTDTRLTEAEVDAMVSNNGYLTGEIDGDAANELQRLSVSYTGDTLRLSKSNWVIVPGVSAANIDTDGDGVADYEDNCINPNPDQADTDGDGVGDRCDPSRPGPLLTDIEGNTYKTIVLRSDKMWMAENLRTTKYNDNADIPLVTDWVAWHNLISPAYCWPHNDETLYKNTYGVLYNGYAISTTTNGGKNVCPAGWHVPDWDEWKSLPPDLREAGYNHWKSPNTGASNISGFTALPAGYRDAGGGSFVYDGEEARFWTQEYNGSFLKGSLMLVTTRYDSEGYFPCDDFRRWNPNEDNYSPYDGRYGASVRCVKDGIVIY
jgi:uncharacterized protein (TIGR02145 family)